jgi:hypothetical protein
MNLPKIPGIIEKTLTSTALLSAGYDPKSQTLQVTFQSGSQYQYYDVDHQVATGLFQAPSKGTYVNEVIKKNGYAYKRINVIRSESQRELTGSMTRLMLPPSMPSWTYD